MFSRLKALLSKKSSSLLVIEGYRLQTSVKLDKPIRTPSGSRVTLVSFCVNVHDSMDKDGNPKIHKVDLWQPRDSVTDFLARCNIAATHTGEAWHSKTCRPESALKVAAQAELELKNSALLRIMKGRYRTQAPIGR